jgi:hypothetical protein
VATLAGTFTNTVAHGRQPATSLLVRLLLDQRLKQREELLRVDRAAWPVTNALERLLGQPLDGADHTAAESVEARTGHNPDPTTRSAPCLSARHPALVQAEH